MHLHRLALPAMTTALKLMNFASKIASSLQAPNKRRCCKLEDSLLDFFGAQAMPSRICIDHDQTDL